MTERGGVCDGGRGWIREILTWRERNEKQKREGERERGGVGQKKKTK